jgi:hypothetical protein
VQAVGKDLRCRDFWQGILQNSRQDDLGFIDGKSLEDDAIIRFGSLVRAGMTCVPRCEEPSAIAFYTANYLSRRPIGN